MKMERDEVGERRDMDPFVSVVIVSYNDIPMLTRLMESLLKQTFSDFEVIIVDNARSQATEEFARRFVVRYFSSRNVGYPAGNNIGASFAKGKFVLVLNPDTWLEPNAIEELVTFVSTKPECLIAAPKIMVRNSKIINSVGMKRFRKWANLYTNIGGGKVDEGQYDVPKCVEAFDGPAFMFRRELLRVTYLFNPIYFYGGDTTDLAERVLEYGFQIWTCPQAVIHHEIHGSYTGVSLDVKPMMVRNILAHTVTNRGLGSLLMTIFAMVRSSVRYLIEGRATIARHYATGVMQFITTFGVVISVTHNMIAPLGMQPDGSLR